MKTTTEQTKEPITNVSEIDIEEELKNGTVEKINSVSETVEEAANNHSKLSWGVYYNDLHPDSAINDCVGIITEKDFKAGAEWLKQQSDTLIKELVEALKMAKNVCTGTYPSFNEWIEYHLIEEALSKANEYLNK